ncbi:MAG: hypothetical protein IPO63_01110 [Bacteroidetes bacterium]|nr:hypothetical protein [Bacteroidota bacterium]
MRIKGINVITAWLPVAGMALFPFILFKRKDFSLSPSLINHERIHLQQQLELLIFPFYIWYLTEYLFFRMTGKKHQQAYRSISFEKEAYQNENDMNYLKTRKRWAYLRPS